MGDVRAVRHGSSRRGRALPQLDHVVAHGRILISGAFVLLTATPTAPGPFRGCVTSFAHAGFDMSALRADGQRVRRTRELIARSPEWELRVSIRTAGHGRVERGGLAAPLSAGSLVSAARFSGGGGRPGGWGSR